MADDEGIYIDFKNWSENDKVDREEYRKKCIAKLERVNGKKVFIINVAADNFQTHKSYGGKVVEISSLCKRSGAYLFELDKEEMSQVINLLLEDCYNGSM